MRRYISLGSTALGIVSLIAAPLSAQYTAHVTVTGGAHAGTYDMFRGPLTCTLAKGATGAFTLSLIDESAGTYRDRVANLMVGSENATEAASGTAYFRFAIGFGGQLPPPAPALRFSAMNRTQVAGTGKLTVSFLNGDSTVNGTFSGVTMDGPDSAWVSASVGCKGVRRRA